MKRRSPLPLDEQVALSVRTAFDMHWCRKYNL